MTKYATSPTKKDTDRDGSTRAGHRSMNGRRTRRFVTRSAVTVGAGILASCTSGVFGAAASAATPATSASAHSSTSGTGSASDPTCSPSTFAQAQQRVEADLSARVTQLDNLLAKVNDPSGHLTPVDKQALQNDLSNFELPGIQALQTQVQNDTTCAELWAAAHSMVDDYRVYLVMTPQTDLTIGADDETYVESRFVDLEPKFAGAIAEAKADGKDVTAAENAFDDLKNQVTVAQGDTNGLSTQLLAQTPHGYPGNWQVFVAAHTSELNARTDLHVADSDAEQIKTDLQ